MSSSVMKTCTKCGETKPLREFHKAEVGKHGRTPCCKECVSLIAKRRRAGDPNAAARYRSEITGTTKTCTTCRKIKPLDDFGRRKDTCGGRATKCKACLKKYLKEYGKNHPDKILNRRYKAVYDITLDDYRNMLNSQGGVCKICKTNADKRRLAVDHDHTTGKVRGLLCANCNQALGHFNDDPAIMLVAINYLQSTGAK